MSDPSDSAPAPEILPPAPSATTPASVPASPRKPVGPKTEAALLALVSGRVRTITDAAKAAGMSREQLSRNLRLQHVQERLEALRREHLGLRGAMAEARLDALTHSARSEYVQLEAAKALLDHERHLKGLGGGPVGGVTIKIDLG